MNDCCWIHSFGGALGGKLMVQHKTMYNFTDAPHIYVFVLSLILKVESWFIRAHLNVCGYMYLREVIEPAHLNIFPFFLILFRVSTWIVKRINCNFMVEF